ncbi:MAG: hypothetical protein F8N39_05815 [Clostridiaceae bacterium]|nr:hypothetical protein [Clostridiaceae bacterium]
MSETDRDFGRLETRVDGLDDWVTEQKIWMKSIEEKVDRVLTALNMGKGAGILLFKLGGFLVTCAMALAWLWDHILKGK